MDIAADLQRALDTVTFTDRGDDEVTELLVEAVLEWGRGRGWRVYRRAASVVPLPPPMQRQQSVLDVACARPDGPPVVVEVDRGDRRRTVDKLAAEAAAGRVAIWVRWGAGRLVPPDPVRLVTVRVATRTGLTDKVRLHSRTAERDLPAPEHTVGDDAYTAAALDQLPHADGPEDGEALPLGPVAAGAASEPDEDPSAKHSRSGIPAAVPAATQYTSKIDDDEIALVLRAYAAFARGDIDGAVADLAEDVDWVEPDELPGGGHHHGPAAVAAYLRASYEGWAELHSEPSARRRGEQVVVVHRVHGTRRDGTAADVTVADVFTVEDGKVVLMMAYADPTAVAE